MMKQCNADLHPTSAMNQPHRSMRPMINRILLAVVSAFALSAASEIIKWAERELNSRAEQKNRLS